jgi:hypothetical protein
VLHSLLILSQHEVSSDVALDPCHTVEQILVLEQDSLLLILLGIQVHAVHLVDGTHFDLFHVLVHLRPANSQLLPFFYLYELPHQSVVV